MNSADGSWYSPRLLLSLISELSFDSRFVAAQRGRRDGSDEWRLWGSRTFQTQVMAADANWSQLHTLGALNWEKGEQPEFDPITDPGAGERVEKRPPSLKDLNSLFMSAK